MTNLKTLRIFSGCLITAMDAEWQLYLPEQTARSCHNRDNYWKLYTKHKLYNDRDNCLKLPSDATNNLDAMIYPSSRLWTHGGLEGMRNELVEHWPLPFTAGCVISNSVIYYCQSCMAKVTVSAFMGHQVHAIFPYLEECRTGRGCGAEPDVGIIPCHSNCRKGIQVCHTWQCLPGACPSLWGKLFLLTNLR